jgi:uncharacterized membrane protein
LPRGIISKIHYVIQRVPSLFFRWITVLLLSLFGAAVFAPIDSAVGLLFVLFGTCAFFFYLEQATRWKLFQFLPPLIFIYVVPLILSNTGVIVSESPVYSEIRSLVLPLMLVLLLLQLDVGKALRLMGRGTGVMLFGTAGVVIGAPLALLVVRSFLPADVWLAFGTLAGSWIGGTGNMAAVSEMIEAKESHFGLAVLADTLVYVVWLPVLLGSKRFAPRFARFTGVSDEQTQKMKDAADSLQQEPVAAKSRDYLYLLAVATGVAFTSDFLATRLPEIQPVISESTWRILLVTTFGISLSFTRLRAIPGSHELGMALVYLFVARMGASAQLSDVATQAFPFLVGAFIWIFIHGAFCLLGAKILRVDVHTAAIASAANIGGAASAPIVAAYHDERLVPMSILMALVGYAIGNYAAYLTAILCRIVAGG